MSSGSYEFSQESYEFVPFRKVATDEPTTKDFEAIVSEIHFQVLSIGA